MSGRRQTNRWGEGSLSSSRSLLQSRQQMSEVSWGTEMNDVSPHFLFLSLLIFYHPFLLHSQDLLFSFSRSHVMNLLPRPFPALLLSCIWRAVFSYFFLFSSVGQQATHKNPEEYAEPSVEWNAGVSRHHSSWHDHQNAQVGAPLRISLNSLALLPKTAKWHVCYAEDGDSCYQRPSELPAAVCASQRSFPATIIHYCSRETPANCSTCCCCSNYSGVGCFRESPPPPSHSSLRVEWLRSNVAILAQKVWRTRVTLHVYVDSETEFQVCFTCERVRCTQSVSVYSADS